MKSGSLFVLVLCLALFCLVSNAFSAPVRGNDIQVLLRAYLQLTLVQQIPQYAASLTRKGETDQAAQIKARTTEWADWKKSEIRSDLEALFKDQAAAKFKRFIAKFTAAEKANNIDYFQGIVQALALSKPLPKDYQSLRARLLETWIKKDVTEGSALLGEIQTWLDLTRRKKDVPKLAIWLTRDKQPAAASAQQPVRKKTLADMEAPIAAFSEDIVAAASPLDTFRAMRKAKQEKILQESRAGMEQVAAERKVAEEEYAARKMAAAEAEAAAMKRHAEELASVEQQAFEQRQQSWNNRLKKIVGATVSAAGGAFLGAVGARAGEEAVNALFD